MPIDNGICFECRNNEVMIMFNYYDSPWSFFELQELASPITFKGKKHTFENCLELERDKASETSDWHICKEGDNGIGVVCERIYNKDDEYCAKHNRECLEYLCKNREGINNEGYCSFHANKCNHCQVRKWVNKEGYCSEHENKCKYLTCETRSNRSNKEYCLEHTYECHVNNHYPPISCSQRVVTKESYCSKHYQNDCQYNSCYSPVSYKGDYCPIHMFKCIDKDCSQRLFKWTYCVEHKNKFCEKCKEVNFYYYSKDLTKENSTSSRCICHSEHYQDLVRIMNKRIIDNEKNQLKSLVKQRTNILGTIEEVERFTTWWSKDNVATIITSNDNDYWVFLGVIDRKPNSTGKVLASEIFVYPSYHSETRWGIYSRKKHNSLRSAEIEASWLRTKLDSDNPILCIHHLANSYNSFNSIVCEPYVKKEYLPSSAYSNPRQYLKLLDIVWVERRFGFTPLTDYQHVGVYIGNGELIHIEGNVFDKKGVRKTSWSEFLKKREGSVSRYSPIIPFKNYKEIIGQLIWAKDNQFREGSYNLKNRNCEHFSNMAVLGINYSQQVKERGNAIQGGDYVVREVAICNGTAATTACVLLTPATCGLSLIAGTIMGGLTTAAALDTIEDKDFTELNNGKGTICLRKEKEEVESKLGKKSNKEAEKYEEEYQAQIEQPVDIKDCIIM